MAGKKGDKSKFNSAGKKKAGSKSSFAHMYPPQTAKLIRAGEAILAAKKPK